MQLTNSFPLGFKITDIVKNDPKTLTVYFRGPKGRAIQRNYMDLVYESTDACGNPVQKPLFPSIHENTESYTYHSDLGLLSAAQFTQPAIIIMEMAIVADLRARQLISPTSAFAGHSLRRVRCPHQLG